MFSAIVNILMLTGPLFMLQIYDRVLPSRSSETLTTLFLLVVFLFLTMGLLDWARGRVMARIGTRLQTRMQEEVFAAALDRGARQPNDPLALAALRDLEAIQRYHATPVAIAIHDLPWCPFFLAVLFVFHPLMGWCALGGGVTLIALTVLNRHLTQQSSATACRRQMRADRLSDHLRDEAEMVQALGMREAAFRRWHALRSDAQASAITADDLIGSFAAMIRALRLLLQSAMLALGAWLVLQEQITAGAMVAGSILLGRALAPIEQVIAGWPIVARAREARHHIVELLGSASPPRERTALPRPKAQLTATELSIIPPGADVPALRMVSLSVAPGQALGVIGPSGAGKSTLARALCGLWPSAGGAIRLDGAALDQYDPDRLGRMIGYLPQRVTLFDGTIAENIARFATTHDSPKVVEAARRAGAHAMILQLPNGYDTQVTQAGGQLSGGQIQRIGLARALYDDPVFLVLDEPNANLDSDGGQALDAAIRNTKARGGAVVIMVQRPAAITECDLLLMLDRGTRRAFGPRDEVLRAMVSNADRIARHAWQGGVA